jgi:hypothetical protein
MRWEMKRVSSIFLILIFIALWAGCTGEQGSLETQGPQTMYVCPTGETVSDSSLCPKSAAPPTTTAPQTTAPTTTVTPTAPSTTSAPTTTAPLITEPSAPKPTLEFVDVDDSLQGPSGEFYIAGKIRNNGDVEMFNVQVRLTLYDRYDKALQVLNSAPIEKIDPGATEEFNLIKARILKTNVATYNLTVQGEAP